MQQPLIADATPEQIRYVWSERWGIPIITMAETYEVEDVEGLAVETDAGELAALVTWARSGEEAEIVTLDALIAGGGHGSRALAAAEERLTAQGVGRVLLVTTNDNARALGFYIRRGYRLVRLHLDAMDAVRERKPSVPEVGVGDVELRDMWELRKEL